MVYDGTIDKVLTDLGYRHYVFGGWEDVYTRREFTEREVAIYEKRAKRQLSEMAQVISDAVDKEIMEELKKEGWFNK